MSIITDKVSEATGRYVEGSAAVRVADKKKDSPSNYNPTPNERKAINSILADFQSGWQTMHLPRVEFNDASLYQRHFSDMLAFNTYQENDGQAMMEDRLGGWKSRAMRPIQRNKAISIAAHETARLTIPKIFAYNNQDDQQEDSAKVMGYLIDWAREQANYRIQSVHRVITSMYSPISWGYSEYNEVYRQVKSHKSPSGEWMYEDYLDEEESGFQHLPLSTDQVFFSNFYERSEQKQDFIILRRIISYDRAFAKYHTHPNFQYVTPGVIVTMDDANSGFYQVYDPHMRGKDVEEIIRWRKMGKEDCDKDTRLVMVNGVLVSAPDAQNPRLDHQYPFDKFYYLPINERCIAGKSLVFALGPESALLNTQYQMINDGNYLNLFPPIITTGSDKVGVDVIVPGLNLAFSDKDVQVNALRTAEGSGLQVAMQVMKGVEASIDGSSQDPVQQGQSPTGAPSTAYEISRIEQNAATVLGLSMKFIAEDHAIAYGKLLLSDVLQYLTVANAQNITEQEGLLYKTFFAKEPGSSGKMNKIKFVDGLPDTMTEDEKMDMSFAIMEEQGGFKSSTTLYKVNPIAFRDQKYKFTIDSDVLNPRSTDLERAMDLETYDRAIANPSADQDKVFTDLLMSTNPKTARDPDYYVKKTQPVPAGQPPTDGGNVMTQGQEAGKPSAPAPKPAMPTGALK